MAEQSYQEFKKIIQGTDQIYQIGKRLSIANQEQSCEFLIQEASTAFAKTLMSLLGFLRFIRDSRYWANKENIVDLSSASVLARQVMEDAVIFFYLSESNLSLEEKQFRKNVWELHRDVESLEVARLGKLENEEGKKRKNVNISELKKQIEIDPLLKKIENDNKGRVLKGELSCVLHRSEILERRGLDKSTCKFGQKVLSNFVHFSQLSHQLMMETNNQWGTSFGKFRLPCLVAVSFAAEAIACFLETFPSTSCLLACDEFAIIDDYREWIRTPFEPRIIGN
jgi:hypothetical protein